MAAEGRRAGVLAMLAATMVLLAGRLAFGVPTLPELFADPVLYVLPSGVVSAALQGLHTNAKPLLIIGLFLGQLAVGALAGGFVGTVLAPVPPTSHPARLLRRTLGFCTIVWALLVAILLPALGAGFLGALTTAGPTPTMAIYLLAAAGYGLVLTGLILRFSRPATPPPPRRITRRALLGAMLKGGAGIVAVALGLRAVGNVVAPGGGVRPPARLPSPITPIGGFYVVSKDLFGVKVDLARWRLTVRGGPSPAQSFSLADLQAMSPGTVVSTLTCISNEVGGDLIGTARWTGVPLKDLLGRVGIAAGGRAAVFTAWDNYQDSLPLDLALDPRTLLAYAIDGAPLPDAHGFPLRLIVPGHYGIKNVKWITDIAVLDHDFVGYWQARGWSDQAIVQTQSQIDVPYDRSVFSVGPIAVGGIAFAGTRGIRLVELSVDGGQTWRPTTLHPPLSPLTWTLWTTTWRPTSLGWYSLTVRATDGEGQLQTPVPSAPIPEGATGYHQIEVHVV